MESEGLSPRAIATFCHHLEAVASGSTGTLGKDDIEAVAALPDAEALGDTPDPDRDLLVRTVVVKLNGGLGTGMGLEGPKSLLQVRGGATFLDLIVRQILGLRRRFDCAVPLLLMNSFRTAEDTERELAAYPELHIPGLPLGFLQNQVPKVDADSLLPASWPADPELEWCPPGHGDLYTALDTTGVLDALLERGLEFAFVSNSDNLGAVLDLGILGHFARERLPFLIEVADRTAADRKGGHLCRLDDGRLALRESAQCPPDETADFQNVRRHRYFNTNSLWLHLTALRRLLDDHNGVLPLPTIVNRKTVDPRDPSSPPVLQLETAMGAAVSLFEGAGAIRVPRRRFSPVKNTNDLLGVRSDAFRLTDDGRVVLDASRTAPPVITLDGRYSKMIDDFEARFPHGAPSLRACDALTVEGDVTFGREVALEGTVRITATAPAAIPDGSTLTGDVNL
jgi:UTP--glucose-1-phosphate uridylyltransferase